MTDSIRLTGIRCYGYTGYLAEEQVLGQWFEVSLCLTVDLTQVGQSDRLEDTLDYRHAIATTQQIIQEARFATIERLATAIAEALLQPQPEGCPPIQQVRVCLTKVSPPIPGFDGQVTVELVRRAAHFAPDSEA